MLFICSGQYVEILWWMWKSLVFPKVTGSAGCTFNHFTLWVLLQTVSSFLLHMTVNKWVCFALLDNKLICWKMLPVPVFPNGLKSSLSLACWNCQWAPSHHVKVFPCFSSWVLGGCWLEERAWQSGFGASGWCMAKRCALRRRHDISLAVESQLLWGCALLELTLALWRVLRAKVCSCEDASSELTLAPRNRSRGSHSP